MNRIKCNTCDCLFYPNCLKNKPDNCNCYKNDSECLCEDSLTEPCDDCGHDGTRREYWFAKFESKKKEIDNSPPVSALPPMLYRLVTERVASSPPEFIATQEQKDQLYEY